MSNNLNSNKNDNDNNENYNLIQINNNNNNFMLNEILNSNEIEQKENSLESLNKLVHLNEATVEKTLPGLIISLILKNEQEIKEEFLINCVSPIIGNLRKPDGSKYKVIKF